MQNAFIIAVRLASIAPLTIELEIRLVPLFDNSDGLSFLDGFVIVYSGSSFSDESDSKGREANSNAANHVIRVLKNSSYI